jgi:hypothetical protein
MSPANTSLGHEWPVRAIPIEEIGQQHDVAGIRKPLRHLDDCRPDAACVHVEDDGWPRPIGGRRRNVQSAFTGARSDRDLFVRHNALPTRLLSSLRFRSILARSQRSAKPFILSDLIAHGEL